MQKRKAASQFLKKYAEQSWFGHVAKAFRKHLTDRQRRELSADLRRLSRPIRRCQSPAEDVVVSPFLLHYLPRLDGWRSLSHCLSELSRGHSSAGAAASRGASTSDQFLHKPDEGRSRRNDSRERRKRRPEADPRSKL